MRLLFRATSGCLPNCSFVSQVRAAERPAAQPLVFQPGALRSSQPRPSPDTALPLPQSGSYRLRPVRPGACTAVCRNTTARMTPCYTQATPGARREPPWCGRAQQSAWRQRAWRRQRSRPARRGRRRAAPEWAVACAAAAGPAARGQRSGWQGPWQPCRRSVGRVRAARWGPGRAAAGMGCPGPARCFHVSGRRCAGGLAPGAFARMPGALLARCWCGCGLAAGGALSLLGSLASHLGNAAVVACRPLLSALAALEHSACSRTSWCKCGWRPSVPAHEVVMAAAATCRPTPARCW